MLDALKGLLHDQLRPLIPLPLWQKQMILAATFIVVIGSYVFLGWLPIQDEVAQQQQQVQMQTTLLAKNQQLAKGIPLKQKEYAELQKQLKVALNMLPKKSQIPDLLESVSWAGKDSGLEFSTFIPEKEITKQIYVEVPVSLNVAGSFPQLMTFLKRVGEMSRIVDMKNLSLSKGQGDMLNIEGQAVTYRFVEEAPKKKKKKRRSR